MTLKGDLKLTGGLTNLVNFMQAVASLKICTLMGSFVPKRMKF